MKINKYSMIIKYKYTIKVLRICRQNLGDAKNRSNYKEEDHPHSLLPPPAYANDYVRERRVNFKLPYDLWWQHSHNQLPGRDDVVHSWNYKKIRTSKLLFFINKSTGVMKRATLTLLICTFQMCTTT